MHKYAVGQKVRCIKTENDRLSRFIGEVFEVAKQIEDINGSPGYELEGCQIEHPFAKIIPGLGVVNCQWAEEHLAPVDEGYDGRQVVAWDKCVWKPERMRSGTPA